MSLAIHIATVLDSSAFGDCGVGALWFGEEIPALETTHEGANSNEAPYESESREVSVWFSD